MAATATFEYKVRDTAGKLKTGKIDAESSAQVATKLKAMGYAPLSVTAANAGMNKELTIPGFGKTKVGLKDLAVFSRQFATMVNSGLSLLRALSILTEQTENKELARVLGEVRNDIETGNSLSSSMGKHPKVFPPLMVNMCKAGEVGGFLDSVMLQIAENYEAEVKLRGKVKAAMTYPVVVFVLAILMCIVMLIFIVPTFASLFDSLGGTLPLPTRVLVAMSGGLKTGGPLLAVLLVVGLQVWKRVKHKPGVRDVVDPLKLKLPVFGPLLQKIALARFARNLGTMMKSGVPILQAWRSSRAPRAAWSSSGRPWPCRRACAPASRQPAAHPAPRLPADGRPDDERRRGHRRAGHHAHEDRGVLRPGGRGDDRVADRPHRAADDRVPGRHRRRHDRGALHADLQDLRPHRVALEGPRASARAAVPVPVGRPAVENFCAQTLKSNAGAARSSSCHRAARTEQGHTRREAGSQSQGTPPESPSCLGRISSGRRRAEGPSTHARLTTHPVLEDTHMLARIRKAQEENEGGFTLIELLVVIIIIGILAAIAIPTFLSQREKGWKSAMKSTSPTPRSPRSPTPTDNNGAYVAEAVAGTDAVRSRRRASTRPGTSRWWRRSSTPRTRPPDSR